MWLPEPSGAGIRGSVILGLVLILVETSVTLVFVLLSALASATAVRLVLELNWSEIRLVTAVTLAVVVLSAGELGTAVTLEFELLSAAAGKAVTLTAEMFKADSNKYNFWFSQVYSKTNKYWLLINC